MSKYCESFCGYEEPHIRNGMCDWEWFKILCAKYGAFDLFAYMATKYQTLSESHSCTRNIYATAIAYGQLGFLEAFTLNHSQLNVDANNGFCWDGVAVLDYISARTSVMIYRHLRDRGAIVTHRAYDRAIACGNIQLAAEIERDYNTCTCGKPSPGYGHCGGKSCKRIRGNCHRGRYSINVPWSVKTYQEIFRAGNIAAAETLWRKFAPNPRDVGESLWVCQYNPENISADSVRKGVDWLLSHYEIDALPLSRLYMYAAGVKVRTHLGGMDEYQNVSEPNVPLIEYLIERKIPVCDYVIKKVATAHLGVYHAVRYQVPIDIGFAIAAARKNMMVFRECMREFIIPVSKDLLEELLRNGEYEAFAEMFLQFPPASRAVDIIRTGTDALTYH
jgi:hypothetical protein